MRSDDRKGKVAVVIGTVTDDIRLFKLQKLTVSVLNVTRLYDLFIMVSNNRSVRCT